MSSLHDNYPDGIDGSHPYFNIDPYEREVCCCLKYKKWDEVDGTWNYCPWCGDEIDWNRWDDVNEVWR